MDDHAKKLKRIQHLLGPIDNDSKTKIASSESIENRMNDVILRLPELAEQIFEKLSDKSLTNCRMVNLLWLGTIDNLEDPSIRITNKYLELKEEYKRIKANRQNPLVFFRAIMLKKKKKAIEEILQKYHEKNPNIMGKLTPLHVAASHGNFFIALSLMTIGVEVNPRDLLQWTPFIHAAENGHLLVCRTLLLFYADVECRTNLEETALHHASHQGHYEICEIIIRKTRNINPQNYDNVTPFFSPVINGDFELCQLFVESNVDTAIITNTYKQTPLHYAAVHGFLQICELLIDCVEDKNPLDFKTCTPFHYAALSGHFHVVKLLIEKNVDVDIKTNDGRTALHFAAKNGHYKVCQLILNVSDDKNLDANLEDYFGNTPLSLAFKKARLSAKHRAVYELFLSLGFFWYKKNLRSRADLSKIDGLLRG